ncbi:MAG: hypothetical protein DRZ79_02795 [Candidatus Cloacimonadota bacterium]|nr:MAG: hypothetical protein DRZ79_02795 [Candidatus Cloacimonadota bacterium]
MSVRVREVRNKRDLKRFILFPYQLYKNNKYWIPPLYFDEKNNFNPKKNPAFEFCDVRLWIAYKNRKIVGRIAGIVNRRFIERWGKNYVRFGWIDFVDDEEVSEALLQTVESWAKELGMEAVHGPLGFTDLDPEGMLIEGFEELGTIATIYNYSYYPRHLEKLGYKKDVDWVEFQVTVPEKVPEKIEKIAEIVKKKLHLRSLKAKKSKDFLPYAKDMFAVLNAAFDELYGVVPLTEKQIDKYIKQYFGFIKAEFVSIILDENDKVAAFGITMPSLSKAFQKAKGRIFPFGFLHILRALKKNDMVDLYLIGVRPDLQNKGVNTLLFNELIRVFIKNKIKKAETNVELESNNKVQAQWKFFPTRQHKRRRCFIKILNEG